MVGLVTNCNLDLQRIQVRAPDGVSWWYHFEDITIVEDSSPVQQASTVIGPAVLSFGAARTLLSSNFKQAYDVSPCPENQHELLGAVKAMISEFGRISDVPIPHCNRFFKELEKEVFQDPNGLKDLLDDIPGAAQRLWTSAIILEGGQRKRQELCSIVNHLLRLDNPEVMKEVSIFVRALNKLSVVRHMGDLQKLSFPPNGKLWRGGSLPDNLRDFYVPGRKYRVPMVLASSMDESVANNFIALAEAEGLPTVRWSILLDPRGSTDVNWRCSHVNLVMKSCLGNKEAEFLFAPYSVFTVKEIKWSANPRSGRYPHEITLAAAVDNQDEPEDLPLAPYA